MIYQMKIAGMSLRYQFLFSNTHYFFGDYLTPCDLGALDIDIRISRAFLEKHRMVVDPGFPDEYLEYRLMVGETSSFLLPYRMCVYHGMVFEWNGLAWMFCAPSGTGKSTQYRQWKKMMGKDIHIINGDMPILQFGEDGSIMIYPSPWNGKERWGSHREARLGGIIYLSQGQENRIRRIHTKELIQPLFTQFMCPLRSEEDVRRISSFEEQMVQNIPIWHLVNIGDLESAVLTKKTIISEL